MIDKRLIDGLNAAIRENPIAASLVGAGVFWMLFGNKVPAFAAAVPGAARSVGDTLSNTGQKVGETLTSAGQKIVDVAAETASGVSQRAGDTLRQAGDAARQAGSDIADAAPGSKTLESAKTAGADALRSGAEAGQRFFGEAQQKLSESLERQPLLLGALGVAIGAGLASAFSVTAIEKETLGAHASDAREKLEGAFAEAKDFAVERGREVLDEVRREAEVQGFTPEAAKQGFKDVTAKVKNVAGAARDSMAGRG